MFCVTQVPVENVLFHNICFFATMNNKHHNIAGSASHNIIYQVDRQVGTV